MLTFLAPLWLYSASALALAGAIALWRGRKNRVPVSSTKLWEGIAAEAAGAKKRFADPLWIFLWLAALLAGIAAAKPQWSSMLAAPEIKLEVEARALRGASEAELFIRCSSPTAPDEMELIASDFHKRIPLDSEKIKSGTFEKIPAAAHLTINFFSADKKIAQRELNLEAKRPLQIATLGRVPESLRRVFNVLNSGENSTEKPIHVLLVASWPAEIPNFVEPTSDAIIVENGDYIPPENRPQPQIKNFDPPEKIKPQTASPLTIDDGKPIDFSATVKSMQLFKTNPEKEIVLTAGGLPFVMVKRSPEKNITRVYVAANLASNATDWPLDISFPIFFAKIVETVRPSAQSVTRWRTTETDLAAEARVTSLSPFLVIAAIGLIACASAGLLRRGLRPLPHAAVRKNNS